MLSDICPSLYQSKPGAYAIVCHSQTISGRDTDIVFSVSSSTQAEKTVRTTKIMTHWICPSAQSPPKVGPGLDNTFSTEW